MTGNDKKPNRFSLSREDRALWEMVKQSAKPLRKPASRAGPPQSDVTPPVADKSGTGKPVPLTKKIKTPPPRPKPAAASRAPALNPLDRRTVQRIARGSTKIDGRIDLHGLTQAVAHAQLSRFLAHSQMRGHKVVLVITGKGSRQSDETGFFREGGVLRRAVPLWLREPGFRTLVVGYEAAHKNHGGDGALYIRLRRRRVDGSS